MEDFYKKSLYNLAQNTVQKKSKNSYLLTKKLLLRYSSFYDFALTQLNVMPSVHRGRFSETVHFYSIIFIRMFKLKALWATTFSNSISNHRSVLGLFCTIYVRGQIYLFKVKYYSSRYSFLSM